MKQLHHLKRLQAHSTYHLLSNWAHFWHTCASGILMILTLLSAAATPDPSFGHLCCTLQVYHLDFFTNLCLHLCSSMFYHAAAYCKEMQKHTCHFPAIEQRNYARAWPLPGVTECSNKGDKNFLSMKISPKAEKHSFWRPFFSSSFYDELQ